MYIISSLDASVCTSHYAHKFKMRTRVQNNRIFNPKQNHFIFPMTYNEKTIAPLSYKDFKQIKTRSKDEEIPECFEIWKPSKWSLT